MYIALLALVLGIIAVMIAMSMRSHIMSIRSEISRCVPKEQEVVEDFIDAPYVSGTERCEPDPLIATDTEPSRDFFIKSMSGEIENPYWNEEGYAMRKIKEMDADNPPPTKNDIGNYSKARVIGTEWEYTQCPSCLKRYNYRGVV